MPKPSKPQLDLLERLGVKNPPPMHGACGFLIDYILKGNGAVRCPTEQSERVALYNKTAQEWVGGKVVVLNRSKEVVLRGTVRYITAIPKNTILTRRMDQRIITDLVLVTHPLQAMVGWEQAKANFINVGALHHAPAE